MSLLRRPVLLLSAAATVAIPGALAAFAVFGHDDTVRTPAASAESVAAQSGNHHQASARRTGPSSAGSAAQADLLPGLTPAGAGSPQSDMRAGASAAIVADARNQAHGVELLRAAAKSGAAISYQGVELISDAAVGGTTTAVAKVWHRGGVTVTQTAGAAASASEGGSKSKAAVNGSQSYVSYDGNVDDPEGVFGLTTPLVSLLARNYVAMYEGEGTAVGRPALIVQVRRADGTLAAQFWLDKRTMLPLRRAVYNTQAHMVGDDKFVQVSFAPMSSPTAGPASAARAAVPTWAVAPAPATFLRTLNDKGWRLPVALPGNLDLYAAEQASAASGPVVDLGFSDGLSVVSLFAQRGTLPAKLPGWQSTRIGGHWAYVNGQEVAVSAQGFVYTLVADAPAPVVDKAVSVLPPETGPGVLGRIGRGLARLATLADPFH